MKNASAVPKTKLYVLDTCVLLHNPDSLFHFEEHDVCLPMVVLDELDNKKKGLTDVARSARQVSRFLDEITRDASTPIEDGFPLQSDAHKGCTGRLYLQTSMIKNDLPQDMELGIADNRILSVVMGLQTKHSKRKVILVSNDFNMRIKARALGIEAQDYKNDKVLEDTDLLYSGVLELPEDFWDTHGKDMGSQNKGPRTVYKIHGPLCAAFFVNQFLSSLDGNSYRVLECDQTEQTATIATIKNYGNKNNAVKGISARNPKQNFALNLLMDPEIDFVTLLGQAGTGKTLLALAAALDQDNLYSQTIVSRATIVADNGEEIGFTPGDEDSKMAVWMGALFDNLEVILGGDKEENPAPDTKSGKGSEKKVARGRGHSPEIDKLDELNIKIRSLGFMRGRTFLRRFIILDEAQNLTPKQMRTLITRAGEGTKVVCMGNLAQIDAPYVSEGNSGLTYVVERFKGWEHFGSIILDGVERSRLAEKAVEVL